MHQDAISQYVAHFRRPEVIQAMVEDYRAGATIDLMHDQEDRKAGRVIRCPVLVPWGKRYSINSPLEIWKTWAIDVKEVCLDCGHFVAEELPADCAKVLIEFFSE